jgi:tetratricopeptide (TPR) repeat protein
VLIRPYVMFWGAAIFLLLFFALQVRPRTVVHASVVPSVQKAAVDDPNGCRKCHAEAVDGFSRSRMAHSMRPGGQEPAGVVRVPGTTITMESTQTGSLQRLESHDTTQSFHVDYVIGSGEHASGYLIDLGGHLFQSPVAYYRSRSAYDLAPGFENKPDPDFTRPVTEGCVFCHAGSNTYLEGSVNAYKPKVFPHLAISCDRCHGPVEAHLAKPSFDNIVSPARLPQAARDSVCEQCHLIGVARVLNPGKKLTDFKAGDALEDTLTIYHNISVDGAGGKFKVISHAEQLALSACARNSGGRMWCGTCHDPHNEPSEPVAFYRERCLICHAKTSFAASHPSKTSDCIGCHMPKRDAQDGGHSVFTDHRIQRRSSPESVSTEEPAIAAWRDPAPALQKRNMGIASIEAGIERGSSKDIVAGYRLLTDVQKQFPGDSELFNSMGNALLMARQYSEAAIAFEMAVQKDSSSSSKQTNLASAYAALGKTELARQHLERALELDPLNLSAVSSLLEIYDRQGDALKSQQLSHKVAQLLQSKAIVSKAPVLRR